MTIRLLLGVFLASTFICCPADIIRDCKVGEFLRFDINKTLFVSSESHVKVKIIASVFGSPDLPKWLRIEQDAPEKSAVLYGTPPLSSPSKLTLEMTGWDKHDYSTKRQNLTLLIDKSAEPPRYTAEFIIKNFDLDTFLFKLQPKIFKEKVMDTWKLEELVVIKVESLLDRGGRVPIPPAKEGVFIAVGGNEEKMYNLMKNDYNKSSGLKPSVKLLFDPTDLWDIDWSKFILRDTKDSASTSNSSMPLQPPFNDGIIQSTYDPPEMRPVPRNFGDLYVLILILPVIIILLIVVILAIIMCCFRQGLDKRDAATPRPQREYHDSIKRTAFQLRQMQPEKSERNGLDDSSRPKNSTTASTPYAQENPTHTSTPYGRSKSPDENSPPYGQPPYGQTPYGQPPPYRMPPPAAVSVTSPDGTRNQFFSADS